MKRFWLLLPIFGLATCWMYILTGFAPDIGQEQDKLKFPKSVQELQDLAQVLRFYYKTSPYYVLLLFSNAYIYKQAFTIPGSALLNILGGALFGFALGFPLCVTLTGLGASCCYMLSKYVVKDLVCTWFPRKVSYLQSMVDANRHQLIYYLLFLRIFPMTPNWLVNIISPIIGIPYHIFVVTVMLGLMPYNFICVQTGEMLASLNSLGEVFTISMLLKLAVLALVALGPSFLLRRDPTPEAT